MSFNRTKNLLLASVVALTVVGVSIPAAAQNNLGGSGWLTQGAEIMPMGKKAFEFRVGFPSTDFGVRIPVVPNLMEVTPFLTMDYVNYQGKWAGYFGDSFGAQLKFGLWKSGPMAVSLGFDLGLAVTYWPALDLAFQIGGPEVKFSYRWNNPKIAVIAGLKMPIRVYMINATLGYIPILFMGGFEYNVLANLNIHAHIEVGPEICAVANATTVGGRFGFQFGISYLF